VSPSDVSSLLGSTSEEQRVTSRRVACSFTFDFAPRARYPLNANGRVDPVSLSLSLALFDLSSSLCSPALFLANAVHRGGPGRPAQRNFSATLLLE
jgi:hypothetical protein